MRNFFVFVAIFAGYIYLQGKPVNAIIIVFLYFNLLVVNHVNKNHQTLQENKVLIAIKSLVFSILFWLLLGGFLEIIKLGL